MTIGIWILGDQLNLNTLPLHETSIPVIMIESLQHVQTRPYHKQKLILVWSAMRHFAEQLRQLGYTVSYKIADSFAKPLLEWVKENGITQVQVMTPSDRPFFNLIKDLENQYLLSISCQINLIPNNHFIWTTEEFKNWASGRKKLLMEYFYREGRQRLNILMEGDKPIGGEWNYDKDNRQPPKGKLNTPPAKWFEPDEITLEVIDFVNQLNIPTYGLEIFNPKYQINNPKAVKFHWGVTRTQALEVLDWFINVRLANFGPYQDAMVAGEETMWHSMISPYLNIGLLHPQEVVEATEKAYKSKQLPLNSVEGFVRQVMGWREYMHGIYHFVDADYPEKNYFNHTQPLPEFFFSGETKMNCLHEVFTQLQTTGYAHHIQRLMILSNFCLIAGFSPQEVKNWFHTAFIDAYDWVMQTNIIGMGLFADGGILASKPYASSANYVNKMSNYCQGCVYDPKTRTGEKACPFNFFYWDFLDRNRDQLESQGRMNFILNNLDKIPASELEAIRKQARDWHKQML